METGDKTEGTPGCLREGDDGEVRCSGDCLGESPSGRLGETTVLDQGREQKLLVKEALHIQMTPRALQPGWRTESPWLLDHCDEEAGRDEQSSPTFDLQ